MADLRDGAPARRDAAVARLRLAGGSAVERLASLVSSDAPPAARAAALSVLEGADDPRALEAARGALGDLEPSVANAAIAVLREWVTREDGTTALEALVAVALDTRASSDVRLAALDGLSDLPREVVQPLIQQVVASGATPRELAPQGAFDDPLGAREWLAANQQASLSQLHASVAGIRERERREPAARTRQEWIVVRGAVHAVLARRGSRVGLYDLRETFDSAQAPLPLDFLAAAAAIGDVSCLEPLARAWDAAPEEEWWRSRLTEAAAGILAREKLTGRAAVVKGLRAKYPGFLKLPTPNSTTPNS